MSEFTGAGIYPNVEENAYHTGLFGPDGGSLSSTEAKRILKAPALYKWDKTHPKPANKAFDFGHLVHSLVLGVGLDIITVPEELLDSRGGLSRKEAKAFVDDARSEGKLAVKEADLEVPRAVANAVLNDPVASGLFAHGIAEQSIYAQDETTGVWMRGRIDWTTTVNGRTTLVDLKTTTDPVPDADTFTRTVATYDYALQREWYRRIWSNITGKTAPQFVHVVVSKTAPYLVGVYEFDMDYEQIGNLLANRALLTYKHCVSTDTWPGLSGQGIALIGPPAYYANQYLED